MLPERIANAFSTGHTAPMDAPSVGRIRELPYLRDLTDEEFRAFAASIVVKEYGPRDIVMSASEPPPGFFIVVEGKARIYRVGRDGREQTLRLVRPGDTFGEVPVFDDGPSPAWVEALEETRLVILPTAEFRQLILQEPRIALSLLRQFARRIRVLTRQVEEMSLQTVESRLARYLFQLAQEEGADDERGIIVPRQLTQQDLATIVGSVREVVGRTMKTLEREGVIEIERDRVIIRDIERLGSSL